MKHQVTIAGTGISFMCKEDESVLKGMSRLGKKGIPLGCCGGGCGICKVEISDGLYVSKVMSRQHVSEEEEAQDQVLACRVMPRSDLTVTVLGKMKKCVNRVVAREQREQPSKQAPMSTTEQAGL